jgi:hypothetical protein
MSHFWCLMQLPLPRYIEKATCTPQIDDKVAVCSSEYDPHSGILNVKIKPRASQFSRTECAIKAKESVQCASSHLFPHWTLIRFYVAVRSTLCHVEDWKRESMLSLVTRLITSFTLSLWPCLFCCCVCSACASVTSIRGKGRCLRCQDMYVPLGHLTWLH